MGPIRLPARWRSWTIPTREFVASIFLRLEVLPQALFNKRDIEVAFYEEFFSAVSKWATDVPAVVDAALREASTYGVEAMDALHVAAATMLGAAELVTTEKPTRAIHRARSMKIGRRPRSRDQPLRSSTFLAGRAARLNRGRLEFGIRAGAAITGDRGLHPRLAAISCETRST